jgi:anti-anti-sigma factor
MTMSDQPTCHQSRAQSAYTLGTLTLRSQRDGDTHVIALAGDLDLSGAATVEQELRRVEATDADVIHVDLGDLEFIDSSGIRLLMLAERRSRWDAGRLLLTRPSDRVFRTFELSGAASRLPFADRRR